MKKTINTIFLTVEIIQAILIITAYLYLIAANFIWPNFSLLAVTFLLTSLCKDAFMHLFKNL